MMTKIVWNRLDPFVPQRFSSVKKTASPTTTARLPKGRNFSAKAQMPTKAKALFRVRANQLRSPRTVPTAGPMARVMKK